MQVSPGFVSGGILWGPVKEAGNVVRAAHSGALVAVVPLRLLSPYRQKFLATAVLLK